MIISRSLKLIAHHANVSTPTTHLSASIIDVSRAHLPSVKFAEPGRAAELQLRLRLAAYWLMFFAEVLLLAAGIFCLAKLGKMREIEYEQRRLAAAEGVPPQSAVTLDEALRAFGAGR
jgi:hypothetical protein